MDIIELIRLATEKQSSSDFIEAEKLYLKAAELGSGPAAHELGVLYIYISGSEGLEPDHKNANTGLRNHWLLGFRRIHVFTSILRCPDN